MRNVLWSVGVLAGLLLVALGAWAVDAPAGGGLQPGKDEIAGPFRPYNVTGKDKHRGKFHSLVSEHGLDPVVLVFVHGDDPSPTVTDLLTKLDALVEKSERIRLGGVVVFLSDLIKDVVRDDQKRDQEATALADKLGKLNHIAVALDVMADVRDGYKLDDKAEVTVIYYNKYRVEFVRSLAPKALDEAKTDALLAEINGKLDVLRGPAPVKRPKK